MSGMVGDTLPEGRRGQLLAVALALTVAALVWLAVVAPVIGWYDARSEALADRRVLLVHMARLAAELPAMRRQGAGPRGVAGASRILLPGRSDAIAAASLQSLIQDMAASAGATLSSVEALPGQQQGALRQIGLRVALSTDWPVLIALLQAVEASDRRLLVDGLELHAIADSHAAIEASFVVLAFRAGDTTGNGDDLHAEADEDSR
jgi:general secretion pathway protein M